MQWLLFLVGILLFAAWPLVKVASVVGWSTGYAVGYIACAYRRRK